MVVVTTMNHCRAKIFVCSLSYRSENPLTKVFVPSFALLKHVAKMLQGVSDCCSEKKQIWWMAIWCTKVIQSDGVGL